PLGGVAAHVLRRRAVHGHAADGILCGDVLLGRGGEAGAAALGAEMIDVACMLMPRRAVAGLDGHPADRVANLGRDAGARVLMGVDVGGHGRSPARTTSVEREIRSPVTG